MATQNLAVVLGEVDDHVALGVVPCALLGLGVVPLLSVARSDLAELVGIAQDGDVGAVIQLAIVGGGTKVPGQD